MALTEKGQFEVYAKKLQGLCEEHNLTYKFSRGGYPISLTVQTTGSMDGQMSMLEEAEDDGYRSPDAKLSFAFKDGHLVYRVSETFTINDALFGKLKNMFRNMHSLWLQYFFRYVTESGALPASQMPKADADGEDPDIVAEAFDEITGGMEATGGAGNGGDNDGGKGGNGGYEYDEPEWTGAADEAR
jgi:hypothetical protein